VALTSVVALTTDDAVAMTVGGERSGNCDVQLTATKGNSNPMIQAMWLRLIIFVFCPSISDPYQVSPTVIAHTLDELYHKYRYMSTSRISARLLELARLWRTNTT
jgi:hypothetical protein